MARLSVALGEFPFYLYCSKSSRALFSHRPNRIRLYRRSSLARKPERALVVGQVSSANGFICPELATKPDFRPWVTGAAYSLLVELLLSAWFPLVSDFKQGLPPQREATLS